MTDYQVTQRQLGSFKRFIKLLPHGQDFTLVILKGHLLIEEQVRLFIYERMTHPEALKEAKLDCAQAISIAKALSPKEHEYIWNAVKKLNNCRNKLAHKAEPVGLDDQIDDFVSSVSWLPQSGDRQKRMEMALWALFEAVSSSVQRSTATVHELVAGKD